MDQKRINLHHMACQITERTTTWFFLFLWGFVKDWLYRTPVRDLADLQEIIYADVNNVTLQMLHNTWVEFEYWLGISHVEDMLRFMEHEVKKKSQFYSL